ncbi:hypothetical protein [Paludisphaera rhizosphaerae]|uniref:hypothetical protein n=1 Tax=Paludisphaera rhizosphaerae TaxID=2711216 RepID=UPI0013EA165A|nr:hypothetical protein [Paludisphaera rhizosphaerae]
MPATEAQIRANRANAQKSTGPRTEAGKAQSRLNALKHGVRSRTTPLVLPQEDPAELEARIRDWMEDCQPTNAVEQELVVRAARASWALDRAERFETALLSRRVRKAMLQSRTKRTAKVGDLGRKLFALAGRGPLPSSLPDDPAAFVAALEESPEGVRWLIARWSEIDCLIRSDQPWTFGDQYRFVRLLGKQPRDAVDDPELNAVFLAWEVAEEGWGVDFWKKMLDITAYDEPAFNSWRTWREIAPRPADPDAAIAMLREIVDGQVERLEVLAVELNEIEGENAVETAERASFAVDDTGERLHRFQTARARELIKTVETLARLRREAGRPEPRKVATQENSPNEPAAATPETTIQHEVKIQSDDPSIDERTRPAATGGPRLRVVARDGKGEGPRGTPSGLRDGGQVATGGSRISSASSASKRAGRRRKTGSPG